MGKTGLNRIEVLDVVSRGNTGDWGQIYTWVCPLCGEIITWAQYGDKTTTCECGYIWTLIIKALGVME